MEKRKRGRPKKYKTEEEYRAHMREYWRNWYVRHRAKTPNPRHRPLTPEEREESLKNRKPRRRSWKDQTPEQKAAKVAKHREWRMKNPDKVNAYYLKKKERYHSDPEFRRKILDKRKRYYWRHKDRVIAANRRYKERIKNEHKQGIRRGSAERASAGLQGVDARP